jgi:predicted ATPase
MLIIGTYREKEMPEDHPVSELLKCIQVRRKQLMESMHISNLTLQDVHDFITVLLNSYHEETLELAKVVYAKVDGNAFFLVQFLTVLRDDKYLKYDLSTMKWTWDESSIRKGTVVSDSVLAILTEKMGKLPDSHQRILQILACMGSTFDEHVVDLVSQGLDRLLSRKWASKDPSEELTSNILEALIIDGLLECLRTDLSGNRTLCFPHDQIKRAVRSLVVEDSLLELKLEIGQILYAERAQIDFQTVLFTVVDLWNGVSELFISQEMKSMLVDLNFQAGRKALESCAFEASMEYLRTAIDAIPPETRWAGQYKLTLQLYNTLLKAEYSNGSWESLYEDIHIVLAQKDRPIHDKMSAYNTYITALSTHQNKHLDAIQVSVDVLSKLGIKFRPKLGKIAVLGALIKTKLLLRDHPLESVLERGEMTDENKTMAISILRTVNASLYGSNPDLFMCTVLRTVRWSLKYGISKHSSRCIGLYGLVEMALGDVEGGTKACKLAIQLAEKQRLMSSEYAPTAIAYGFVLPWTTSIYVCQKWMLNGYNVGLQEGDLEYAFINITLYCFMCYSSGKPLVDLEADMRDYANQMAENNQTLQLNFLSLTWQTVLNLMNRGCDDPTILVGEVMKQEKMLELADREKLAPLRAQLQCHRLQLAVYYGDYELASQLLVIEVGKTHDMEDSVLTLKNGRWYDVP